MIWCNSLTGRRINARHLPYVTQLERTFVLSASSWLIAKTETFWSFWKGLHYPWSENIPPLQQTQANLLNKEPSNQIPPPGVGVSWWAFVHCLSSGFVCSHSELLRRRLFWAHLCPHTLWPVASCCLTSRPLDTYACGLIGGLHSEQQERSPCSPLFSCPPSLAFSPTHTHRYKFVFLPKLDLDCLSL